MEPSILTVVPLGTLVGGVKVGLGADGDEDVVWLGEFGDACG